MPTTQADTINASICGVSESKEPLINAWTIDRSFRKTKKREERRGRNGHATDPVAKHRVHCALSVFLCFKASGIWLGLLSCPKP